MSTLYIIATPIGNLDDITIRAQNILSSVATILAEDTRQSRKLLDHIGVSSPELLSYHDHNKEKITPRLIESLKSGKDMAIISDAGTPGIADEAFYLVRAALQENIKIISVPGACAVITALVASGLPTDRFVFDNFLPVKSARRRRYFEEIKNEPRTVVFYESPYRIVKVLTEMHEVLGDVPVVLARELTKIYEEYLRGTPKVLLEHFSKKKPRGEFVVLVNTRILNQVQTISEFAEDDEEEEITDEESKGQSNP